MYGYSYGYTGEQQADAILNEFEVYVRDDGGTDASPVHTGNVFNALRTAGLFDSATLICPCTSGKESNLYYLTP